MIPFLNGHFLPFQKATFLQNSYINLWSHRSQILPKAYPLELDNSNYENLSRSIPVFEHKQLSLKKSKVDTVQPFYLERNEYSRSISEML